MNEKTKKYIQEQNQEMLQTIRNHFSLPTFQDDIAQDEVPDVLNYFLLVYGDIESVDGSKSLSQEIFVVYVCEDNDFVDEQSIDVISMISNVKGINFKRTMKRRLQKKDQDEYLDQVTFIFNRKMPYECKI
ncbi:hypothetical protein [Alkalihalobacillus sp. LMS39]|uniref:hypothetical protein n=1 Tax=Alkalihalobacillus sp. LMS39 TaxID=2924032 RepID=UPI001FB1FDBB|nr:hypothetical protein [Alkalihalobacillus sp. LMS39]UOE96074.1 hypothetical protein MM271_10940 [Alkalihalobacillus sp. LMS39]